ncbi:uncharacterized protein LOC119114835, partial [Pollicipes pollicipes]|uniref:uncharacterized protein LOC119114835 n=1 Tax=Pollicipes pollicipes TaxID=41117 RepID=UPI001885912E
MSQPSGGRTGKPRGGAVRVGTSLPARAVEASLPARAKTAASQQQTGSEIDRLRQEFRRRTGSDSDDEFEEFVNKSRQRFQNMLADGGLRGMRLSQDDPFRQMLGSGHLDAGFADGAFAFAKARPAALKDQAPPPSARPPSLKASPSAFGDRPSLLDGRLSLLNGGSSLLSSRPAGASDDGALDSALMTRLGGGSGALSPNGLGSLAARRGGGLAATLSSSSVQQTFQTSTCSTTITSRGGGGAGETSVTRVSRQQKLDQSSRDGVASVQQHSQQKVEAATVTQKSGRTRVDARRAELSQRRTAGTRADGTAEVSQEVSASAATRRALFEQADDGGPAKQVSLSGEDFKVRAQLGMRQTAVGDGGGGQLCPSGGAVSGPLWRFFDMGPLIQPPGMRISGRIAIQASHSAFSSKDGGMPRITGDQISFEDSFGDSESESD